MEKATKLIIPPTEMPMLMTRADKNPPNSFSWGSHLARRETMLLVATTPLVKPMRQLLIITTAELSQKGPVANAMIKVVATKINLNRDNVTKSPLGYNLFITVASVLPKQSLILQTAIRVKMLQAGSVNIVKGFCIVTPG